MALERLAMNSRAVWLEAREAQGLGGSEAAAIVGLSPWMSATELWQIKTGIKSRKNFSNEAIEKGIAFEPVLRELFKAKHPEYDIEYHQFDLLYQSERPWLFATLDGEIRDNERQRQGILEIKTASPQNKAAWAKWDNATPLSYRAQITHQLLATGYDFATLFAYLFNFEGDMTIREYNFERERMVDDMDWLLEKETAFWHKVQTRQQPDTVLVL